MSEHEPAPLVEQIAAVLAMHVVKHRSISGHNTFCTCGWSTYTPFGESAVEKGRPHVASQLARLVEREKHKAWAEGALHADRAVSGCHLPEQCPQNPYARD